MANCGKMQAGNFSSLEGSYLYAPACRVVNPENVISCWAPAITRLLAAGYSFLGNSYTEDGFLFRGMETGVMNAITNGSFGHFDGSREESGVERIMDICFFTREIRDALTVADMRNNRNGCILVLSARHFNRALSERRAAVMAIGDSGMVFGYPFLADSVLLDEIDALVITQPLAEEIQATHPALRGKLIIFNPETDGNNEEILRQSLSAQGIKSAAIMPDTVKPRRKDLAFL